MDSTYTIQLSQLINEFQLKSVYLPKKPEEILISSTEVSRPGLALAGFFEEFEPLRIQIIGLAEHKYLAKLSPAERRECLESFLKLKPATVVVTTDLSIFDELVEVAEKYEVTLFKTLDRTSSFMAAIIASLNTHLGPRITRSGVLVEVYGEGMLILGDSGIGKSETAIELVKRGHRLIADDAVEIKKVSSKTLVGTAPELIRHYIELRGIGIVDVRRLFGMGAVKQTERIDMVVKLEPWDSQKMYDRFGLTDEFENILGIDIPSLVIPVKPGRNLSIILEVAAMNNRQKKMGYNTAEEFNKRLLELME